MNEFMIGYARVSTNEHDLTAQRNALEALGVRSNLIYTDHGLTGTSRARPGLREALAACRNGDTLVVATLDRLARSLPDAKDMLVAKAQGHLRGKQPKLSAAQQRHLMEARRAGTHSTAERAELFNVARSTVYRTVHRQSIER
jgi:DNA invertase Pin-like site-specific DNA recombinase